MRRLVTMVVMAAIGILVKRTIARRTHHAAMGRVFQPKPYGSLP